MPKQRNHNEWFFPVELGGRKSCPTCKEKLEQGQSIWGWYEYRNCRKFLIKHFCQKCYSEQVRERLTEHTVECGCTVELVVCGAKRPDWLTLESIETCAIAE